MCSQRSAYLSHTSYRAIAYNLLNKKSKSPGYNDGYHDVSRVDLSARRSKITNTIMAQLRYIEQVKKLIKRKKPLHEHMQRTAFREYNNDRCNAAF